MASWELRLTWLNCNQRSYIWILGGHCVKMFGQLAHRRQSYFSTYMCLFNCQRKNKNIIYANVYGNTINDGDSQTSPLPIFPEGRGTSAHRLRTTFPRVFGSSVDQLGTRRYASAVNQNGKTHLRKQKLSFQYKCL